MNVSHSSRRPRSARPCLEPLEARTVPVVVVAGPTSDASNQSGPQSEVGVAVNPLDPYNAVAVSNDITNLSRLPAYYTLDAGTTWRTVFLNNTVDGLGAGDTRYDPNVAFDSDGNVYVVYSVNTSTGNRSRLIVCKSSDGGATYTQAGTAFSYLNSSAIHTAAIATRADPGPEPDDVFVVWSLVQGGAEFVQASLSFDGGATFPVVNLQINDRAPERTFMSWAAVDSWGYFHVIWEVNLPGTAPDGVMKHDVLDPYTLEDYWETDITPLMLTDFAQSWSRIPAQPDRGIFSVGTIDVDRSGGYYDGRIYFSYADRVSTTTNDTNIFVRYSDDFGFTWSDPIRVNDDDGVTSQFLPRLAVDQVTGLVFMNWYDARQDETNRLVHVYGAVSLYGGDEWLPNVQLTEEPSNESTTNTLRNGNNYGEYLGLAANYGIAYGAWTDARASHFPQSREEVYFGYFYAYDFDGAPGRRGSGVGPSLDLNGLRATNGLTPAAGRGPAARTEATGPAARVDLDIALLKLEGNELDWVAPAALPSPDAWLTLAALDWHILGLLE